MSSPQTDAGARVRAAFAASTDADRAAFVAYIMAGFPSDEAAVAAGSAALRCGADLLEVGVPFSDPLADGPLIAEAGRATVARGGGFGSALRMIAALRARGHEQPIMTMTYLNPLLANGGQTALAELAAAGCDGLILPDLPAGEMPAFERAATDLGLALAFLVAPNTSDTRLEAAIRASTGFLYVVPLFGVTGTRDSVAAGATQLLDRVRAAAAGRVPIAAGFGISTPAQAAELAAHADGIAVGSALVRALRDEGAAAVGELVHRLSSAAR
ncbi:MAG TPA: tryptophan synthase subunit alpha [Candidatus Limnocylindria bacterium]|nr:tryptophan synthase subunit alpha [Candidatus Limnocylindria bacterium]